ncbi:hypothetical protein GFY24_25175 [Nocardia sp. SYP-A9097]|nr:hypothetical protein [Nocardia sp. SYP-A9097]
MDDPALSAVSPVEFADALLRAAANPDRIGTILTRIMQDHTDIGPNTIGPGGLLSVQVVARTDTVQIDPHQTDHCQFGVHVPVQVWIVIRLGEFNARLIAGVHISTRIMLVPDRPCVLVVQHQTIRAADVLVTVRGRNTLGWIMTRFGLLGPLLAAQVAAHANTLLSRPDLVELSRIDVLTLIDRAWDAANILAVPYKGGLHAP